MALTACQAFIIWSTPAKEQSCFLLFWEPKPGLGKPGPGFLLCHSIPADRAVQGGPFSLMGSIPRMNSKRSNSQLHSSIGNINILKWDCAPMLELM